MKQFQLIVSFRGEIDDNIDLSTIHVDLDLSQVSIRRFVGFQPETLDVTLHEYETMDAEELSNGPES